MREKSKITITDIANALGMSKTTVSRSISGKGKISKETVARVLAYVEVQGYYPNGIAKSLAQSNTFNIAFVIPDDQQISEISFFQSCLMGVCEAANDLGYNVIVVTVPDNDIAQLTRIIRHHKVEGVILSRSIENDVSLQFLLGNDIPFVLIGQTSNDHITQVDHNHLEACYELTNRLLKKGICRPGMIGGDESYIVNKDRTNGFTKALTENNVETYFLEPNAKSKRLIAQAVDRLRKENVDCIFCMDDMICANVLYNLSQRGVVVPKEIKVASFYNSPFLDNHYPSITAIQYNVKEIGQVACKTLLDMLTERQPMTKKLLGYEVVLKDSTE